MGNLTHLMLGDRRELETAVWNLADVVESWVEPCDTCPDRHKGKVGRGAKPDRNGEAPAILVLEDCSRCVDGWQPAAEWVEAVAQDLLVAPGTPTPLTLEIARVVCVGVLRRLNGKV